MFTLRRCCVGAALGLSLLACTPQPARAQTNLLRNPGFEATVTIFGHRYAPPWVFPAHVQPSSGSHAFTGTKFARYTVAGSGGFSRFGQAVTFPVVGVPYRLSAWTHISLGSSPISASYATIPSTISSGHTPVTWVESHFTGASFHRWHSTVRGAATTRGYRQAAGIFTPSKSHDVIFFLGGLNKGVNLLGVDDVSLTGPPSAPEVNPRAGAPALALALGGLALMVERRRRKVEEQAE